MFGNTREGAWGPRKQLGLLTSREVGHSRGGGKELCPQGMALHYKNYFGWIQSQGKKQLPPLLLTPCPGRRTLSKGRT